MSADSTLVTRITPVLRADPSRVISKFFLPGAEVEPQGILHVDTVLARILKMSDEAVIDTLNKVMERYSSRHFDIGAIFAENFGFVAHHLTESVEISVERRNLIGAYFTQEFAVEGAALFNPSIVMHPDQTGMVGDEIRFILSVRALGEGHVSCIEFRTGVFSKTKGIQIDEPGKHLIKGTKAPIDLSHDFLREALSEHLGTTLVDELLGVLPLQFDSDKVEAVISSIENDSLVRNGARDLISQIRHITSANYRLEFPAGHSVSEFVIFPKSADERNGIEDARFTYFTDKEGQSCYYATYTAFDGLHLSQHLLKTDNFRSFEITKLIGPASRNKGMALFPRPVNGQYLALSRWDNETISVSHSKDLKYWNSPIQVQYPEEPWEYIKLGNCGSPIETPDGWLVLTHGVGPMREYGIGAILLDLDDPSKMIGSLGEPLLSTGEDERDGYVPNVVYSCGSLLNQDTLILPYGCSDSTIRIAYIDFPDLMSRLRSPKA